MKTIFISGIHGVGKSYICGIINKELGISHYSASSLIREYREDLVAANKAVQNIKVNQSALVEQYHKLKDENLIIMDNKLYIKLGENFKYIVNNNNLFIYALKNN